MKAENLQDLLVHEIRDLYSAEEQILEALPKMIDKATDRELKSALSSHLEETKRQKTRLEDVARVLEIDAGGHKCKGIAGIIKEGEETIKKDVKDDDARDAAIIGSAQRVEHYEMAGYGTARTYARMLGNSDVVGRLEETLNEEKSADEKLTRIAEDHVNRSAMK